jgi:hypothetical protein
MNSKNINLQDIIKRDLYNKFSEFISDIKKKINNNTNNMPNFIISDG